MGSYDCWAAAGVAGSLNLEITSGSTYAGKGKSGSYAYDPRTLAIHQFRMTFQRRGSGRHAWMILTMRWMPRVN
ncbi:MAG: hypothetical protein FD149_2273, partial [Rhodospirillaceae bacterium]